MPIEQDASGRQEVHTYDLNGQTITAKRQDPYGFLHITSDKPLHKHLDGVFTTTWGIERAIRETKAIVEDENRKKKQKIDG